MENFNQNQQICRHQMLAVFLKYDDLLKSGIHSPESVLFLCFKDRFEPELE